MEFNFAIKFPQYYNYLTDTTLAGQRLRRVLIREAMVSLVFGIMKAVIDENEKGWQLLQFLQELHAQFEEKLIGTSLATAE